MSPWMRVMSRRIRVISSSVGVASARAHSSTVDGGGEPFPGAQQVIEVGVQVGQVGDVGAEVVAAGAAEPDGAGAAAGCDVGGFGAPAEGDGDLPDRVAGVFGVQQGLGVAPDPVAVPVETAARSTRVDGFAAALFLDPVVACVVTSRVRWSSSSESTSMGTPASAWRWA